VILGDQPDIDATVIDRLLAAQATSGLPAAALSFDGLLHPPMVLTRSMWADIDALAGDVGLRALIRSHPESVFAMPAERPGGHPVDIDTREDYEQLTRDPA
jgi:molybdenum cofactor cytidylyltransferase